MTVHKVFRDNQLHVLEEKCSSCIFRPIDDGRVMGLQPGRVAGMVREAKANGSVIPCHNTIYDNEVKPAVCRGYFRSPGYAGAGAGRATDGLGGVRWTPAEAWAAAMTTVIIVLLALAALRVGKRMERVFRSLVGVLCFAGLIAIVAASVR